MTAIAMTQVPRVQRVSQFMRRLALKPYGDELLTRSADFWIFSARLIILTMATAEALAWGYMGSLMSRTAPLVTGAIAAAFIFVLVWIIDATFMTLDLSRGFYEPALTGRKRDFRLEKLKLVGGVLARVGIVTASLVITAPFLAQAIFAGDVSDEMSRRNAETIAEKRREVEQTFVTRADEVRREQRALEQQRVLEAAGSGPSRKYGRGPVIETIERQLGDKRNELAAIDASRASALARFDSLSPAQLQQQYGLQFLTPGVQASTRVLEDVLRTAPFAGAEVAVRAFLAFLFLGLLILKGFQPRSVAVYYSEQLHSVHDEYRKGLFDAYLPPAERAEAGANVDPLRFEEWCLSTYASMRREDERRRETAAEYRVHELLIEQWQRLETATRTELDPLLGRYDAALAAVSQAEEELVAARAGAAAAAAELAKVETSRASMLQHIERGSLDVEAFDHAVAASRQLEERSRALALDRATAEGAAERAAKRVEVRNREAARLHDEIETKQAVLAEAQKRISGERLTLAQSVGAQREMWSGRG